VIIARALPSATRANAPCSERFTAVTRATLKGTLVVGAVQGISARSFLRCSDSKARCSGER
jgi:hypothetical protein